MTITTHRQRQPPTGGHCLLYAMLGHVPASLRRPS
jgi:hypothetical protein